MAFKFDDLSAQLDGELDEAARAEIESLARTNPIYGEELQRMAETRRLLEGAIQQPGFHHQLMERVKRVETDGRFQSPLVRLMWRGMAAAACLAITAAVLDYSGIAPLGAAGPRPEAMQRPVWTAHAGGGVPGDSATAALANGLALAGTVGGVEPLALIAQGDAPPTAYRVGDVVAPGVTLADVRYGQAIVRMGDASRILHLPAAQAAAPLAGQWEFRAGGEAVAGTVRERGAQLTVSRADGRLIAQGDRTGNHIRLYLPSPAGELRFEGDWSPASNRLLLTQAAPAAPPGQAPTIEGRMVAGGAS